MIGISLDIPEVAIRSGSFSPPLIGTTAPTIFADFTVNHYYSGGVIYPTFAAWNTAISGTFTRASSGTFLSGGVVQTVGSGLPRIGSQGFRLTAAATNIWLQSNTFTTSPWTLNSGATATPNAAADPAGGNNAWLFRSTAGSGSNVGYISTGGLVTLAPQTLSIYAKQNDAPSFVIQIVDQTAAANTLVNLTVTWHGTSAPTGAVGGSASGVFRATQLANGWWRIGATYTATTTAGDQLRLLIYPDQTGVGSTAKSTYFYGTQFSNTSIDVDYVPTTTVAATQAADAFSTPWSAITSGTLVAQAVVDDFSLAARQALQIDDGTDSNRATLGFNTGAAGAFDFLSGGVSQAGLSAGSLSAGTLAKLAAAFAANDFALVVNNGTPQTDASGAVPAFSALRMGSNAAGGANLQGYLTQMAVWSNLRGSNAVLGTLST